ncbi:MAG: DUF131 domain-containing protein [Thermoplasmatales archaeon]|nr:DUF131 domain-containing protein [Candidatus Thermoplasmatota archaeon]MCL6003326.1 DUF131 domain-containing protein [Candidatus Thermoplasmatota archaeon]MDA8054139.1 DUF131 domain-containing protein [Thermoplasmatales archaeon]
MRIYTSFLIALLLFIGSEALLAYFGYVRMYLVFFIPVFVSQTPLAFAPLLFFLFPLILSFRRVEESNQPEGWDARHQTTGSPQQGSGTKIGGIVMIGPVPIVFGKGVSGRVLIILAVIMLILIISWFVLSK